MPCLLASAAPAESGTLFFLIVAVGLALSFEFVNGFHDTANAVATVIYTNTLKPLYAVVWSGIWNLIGVLTSSGTVAFGIIALLPVELVLNIGSTAGFAMVFSLLSSAIAWNVGTWWLGLPASSSHTLIGSILGVGLANALMAPAHSLTSGVNWAKAKEIALSLLISPLVGFAIAAGLLLLCKALIKNESLYRAPEGKKAPPGWIRGILMLTCTGVSFAHGSNDGQKGMGLIMLILVGILPGAYALKMDAPRADLEKVIAAAHVLEEAFEAKSPGLNLNYLEAKKILSAFIKPDGTPGQTAYGAVTAVCGDLIARLKDAKSLQDLPATERGDTRSDLFLLQKSLVKLKSDNVLDAKEVGEASTALLKGSNALTNYIPLWVKYSVALALGFGTMIGWKRIVVTVGEKIGKSHLTYAQGAAAELTTMGTILAADHLGLPVSTTHVLSSGITGTMAANQSGLQGQTLRNILLAWVLTLPVCIFLGAVLFAFAINAIAFLGFK
jgi:PiT family inorganic phosphate transporter